MIFKIKKAKGVHGLRTLFYDDDYYLSTTRIKYVFKSNCIWTNFVSEDENLISMIHSKLREDNVLQCNCKSNDSTMDSLKECLRTLHIYSLKTKNAYYGIHPCEKEHVERYLAGTDDPMYDFVHELRYHPDSLLGREKEAAEAHFKKQKIDSE